MDFINDNTLPQIVKTHLEASVSKVWKSQEESSFLKLASLFGVEKVLNAFAYLQDNGIPPFGERTTEPFTFLSAHDSLINAFNVGFRAPTKVAEVLSTEIPQDLISP